MPDPHPERAKQVKPTRYRCCWHRCQEPSSSYYANGGLNFCDAHANDFEAHRRAYAMTCLPRRVRLRRRLAYLLAPEGYRGN